MNRDLLLMMAGVLILLVAASIAGWIMARRAQSEERKKGVANFNARTKSWWVMTAVFGLTLWLGHWTTVVLFGLISFLALREFITLNRTRPSDHHVLFWSFFVFIPVQYFLIGIQWYGMASIFIPVYVFTFIPIRKVLAGDVEDFLATTAKIQWGVLTCVYFVSHMPLIMTLPVKDWDRGNGALLFFFVFTVQASDVFQYLWGKSIGKRKIAPRFSPNKTVEGTIGGILSATLAGMALSWVTPFSPGEAALMALLICTAGFFGGLVMSAIKRDLGAKDWGTGIAGHGGVMDRIDSLCFAAPLFFHLTGFYFGTGVDPRPPEWILPFLGK
ncbi:MAG TPA: phosphatidate cytidylyltransferase [Verrucomicrobiales bacterium]|nr:phosphatidate cytidylyltransferase [Verrucomicrobiales bacterium]